MKKRIIAITGGIGSGKSVVQSILKAMGHDVYDCDSRAKEMMDTDNRIIAEIRNKICPQAVVCDRIDRSVLAGHVFNDAASLEKLNRLVHREVINDFRNWCEDKDIAFVETAILCTSGLDKEVNEIWLVSAPEELRVSRVMKRNPQLPECQIEKRIEAQRNELEALRNMNTREIKNDNIHPLLPQIESLLIKD